MSDFVEVLASPINPIAVSHQPARTSLLLVTIQVALCLALLWFGWNGVVEKPWLWTGILGGTAVSTAGVMAMRMSRVRVAPEPGKDAELCERGIYAHIRHPMYAGVSLAFAMFAFGSGRWWGWAMWLGLLAVLMTKLRIEERLWAARDERYRDYMRRTKRIIPGLW